MLLSAIRLSACVANEPSLLASHILLKSALSAVISCCFHWLVLLGRLSCRGSGQARFPNQGAAKGGLLG